MQCPSVQGTVRSFVPTRAIEEGGTLAPSFPVTFKRTTPAKLRPKSYTRTGASAGSWVRATSVSYGRTGGSDCGTSFPKVCNERVALVHGERGWAPPRSKTALQAMQCSSQTRALARTRERQHARTHASTHARTHRKRARARPHTQRHTHTEAHSHTHTRRHARTRICTHLQTHTHTHTPTHRHTDTGTHTYAHARACTPTHVC